MLIGGARSWVLGIVVCFLSPGFLIAADSSEQIQPGYVQLDFGSSIRDLWVGPNDVWFAVGENLCAIGKKGEPLIMHRGFTGTLSTVWGTAADNVFVASSQGPIYHFDGAVWEIAVERGINSGALWGSSEKDVFSVGREGVILHFDGEDWSLMDSGTNEHLLAVHGSSPKNVFAVGSRGTVLRFDGETWSRIETPYDNQIMDVWVGGENEVYIVGTGGLISRFNGDKWTRMIPRSMDMITGVEGHSTDLVYAIHRLGWGRGSVILRFDGSSWSTFDKVSDLLLANKLAVSSSGSPAVALSTIATSESSVTNGGAVILYLDATPELGDGF